ncbi:hypothetical protein EON63_21160 [archaeon]|nr:MAG: hypothetical protein EON63_21160 [archaeon]
MELQRYVNSSGFDLLNLHCFLVSPVNDTYSDSRASIVGLNQRGERELIHPLAQPLYEALRDVQALKNVDLLFEVERLCVLLGGCRITFCKSGELGCIVEWSCV